MLFRRLCRHKEPHPRRALRLSLRGRGRCGGYRRCETWRRSIGAGRFQAPPAGKRFPNGRGSFPNGSDGFAQSVDHALDPCHAFAQVGVIAFQPVDTGLDPVEPCIEPGAL